MYKEINLPEVVAALISDGVGEVRVNRVKLKEMRTAIINEDRFMNVDFSVHQFRRVAYLGRGHIKVESAEVVIGETIPTEVRRRFQICYNSLDSDSKRVLESSIKALLNR